MISIVRGLTSLVVSYIVFVLFAFIYSFGSLYASKFDENRSLLIQSILSLVIVPFFVILCRRFFKVIKRTTSFANALPQTFLVAYPIASTFAVKRFCPKCIPLVSSLSSPSFNNVLSRAFFPAVAEEVFFNGFVAPYLFHSGLSASVSAFSTSVLVCIGHYDALISDYSPVSAFLSILLYSYSQSLFSLNSRTFIPCVLNHFIVNFVTIIAPLKQFNVIIRLLNAVIFSFVSFIFMRLKSAFTVTHHRE
ncbi:hypothetical protein RCL1_002457 [Eukaryota sp. TZLM3-RCL]